MKLLKSKNPYLFVAILLVASGCNENEAPISIEGTWSLSSLYMESQTEIPSRNLLTDPYPCFYDSQGDSPRVNSQNTLTLRADLTGHLSWDIDCTDAGNFIFNYQLNDANEITVNHTDGNRWFWTITSLSRERMEVAFTRETDFELPSSGPAIEHESFEIVFTRQ